MRTAIFIGLFMTGGMCSAQTVLNNAILDTMIMEVKYSRQCRITVDTLQKEIAKQGKELVATGKALELSQSSNSTLSALLNNSREANVVQAMQFQKDLQTEKRKVKRWRRIGIIQAIVIIAIILTPSI